MLFYMKFTAKIENFNSTLWGHHVTVSKEIAQAFVIGNDRRVCCEINEKFTFQCALMPHGDGDFFINLNKELRKKLNLEEGMEISIGLTKDTSEYGLPMPEELQELLLQDEEGNAIFHALTLGKQRTLLHIVGKYKSSDVRLTKAIIILNYLKSVNGKLDFKELNEAFKNQF